MFSEPDPKCALFLVQQPYLHESRHQHALRRARGCGGRFLNTKPEKKDGEQGGAAQEGANSSGGATTEAPQSQETGAASQQNPNNLPAGQSNLQHEEQPALVYANPVVVPQYMHANGQAAYPMAAYHPHYGPGSEQLPQPGLTSQ